MRSKTREMRRGTDREAEKKFEEKRHNRQRGGDGKIGRRRGRERKPEVGKGGGVGTP